MHRQNTTRTSNYRLLSNSNINTEDDVSSLPV